jgi:arginine N-succinyltransferase
MNEWIVRREFTQAGGEGAWTLTALDGNAAPQGSLRIRPNVGTVQPRSWYRCGLSLHGAAELQFHRLAPTLTLCSDLNAFHEIDDVASGDAAVTSLLLQAARLWLLRETTHVRAFIELREPSAAGSITASAFFRSVSRHFLPTDAARLHDELSRGCWPASLAGLLPRHPIYLDILPDEVRKELVSKPRAAPQLVQALEANGLMCGQFVNVVDGGCVACGTIVPPALAEFERWRQASSHSTTGGSLTSHSHGVGSLSIDSADDVVRLTLGDGKPGGAPTA